MSVKIDWDLAATISDLLLEIHEDALLLEAVAKQYPGQPVDYQAMLTELWIAFEKWHNYVYVLIDEEDKAKIEK